MAKDINMPRDYYIILGVSRDAALVKIKRAYRRAVKRYHPDVTGLREGAEKFKKIKEAYETLQDEEKRKSYDEELARERSPFRITEVPSLVKRRTSLFDEIDTFSSRADDFFSGFLPGFFDRGKEKRIEKDLYLDLTLSSREAAEGGLFPITVPVIERCPRCSRSGFWDDFICPLCKGCGRIRSEREFGLSVPPRVKHGTEIKLSMEDIGLRDSYLNITVLIDPTFKEEW